jgi:hypothetical protein
MKSRPKTGGIKRIVMVCRNRPVYVSLQVRREFPLTSIAPSERRVEEGVRWFERGEAGVDAAQQTIVRELLAKYSSQAGKTQMKAASV